MLGGLYNLEAKKRLPLAFALLAAMVWGIWQFSQISWAAEVTGKSARLVFSRSVPSGELLSHVPTCCCIRLVDAVRQWESGGQDGRVGDRKLRHKAYTSLQVRQPALDDVNAFYQKEIKKLFGVKELTIAYLMRDRQAQDWLFHVYTSRFATRERLGREPTDEDCARIWNGGPDGWMEMETVKYWQHVQMCRDWLARRAKCSAPSHKRR